jgi:hypothetical protein
MGISDTWTAMKFLEVCHKNLINNDIGKYMGLKIL